MVKIPPISPDIWYLMIFGWSWWCFWSLRLLERGKNTTAFPPRHVFSSHHGWIDTGTLSAQMIRSSVKASEDNDASRRHQHRAPRWGTWYTTRSWNGDAAELCGSNYDTDINMGSLCPYTCHRQHLTFTCEHLWTKTRNLSVSSNNIYKL